MKLLVTGADGQLGNELRRLENALDAEWEFTDIGQLDLADSDTVERHLIRTRPDVVVNCAAYTAVDRAEQEPEMAATVNRDTAANLSRAVRSIGSRLLHISTDFVFDGELSRPYLPGDEPNPLGVYGTTKREGELAVLKESARGVIVRTSWLYSSFGSNFVKTMLRLAEERDELTVVQDQVGSPTWAHDLAEALVTMIPRLSNDAPVIYHFSNVGAASWYDFAQEIMRLAGLETRVLPIPSSEYPTPAQRPAQSRLDTSDLERDFGIEPRYWRDSLARCIAEIRENAA